VFTQLTCTCLTRQRLQNIRKFIFYTFHIFFLLIIPILFLPFFFFSSFPLSSFQQLKVKNKITLNSTTMISILQLYKTQHCKCSFPIPPLQSPPKSYNNNTITVSMNNNNKPSTTNKNSKP